MLLPTNTPPWLLIVKLLFLITVMSLSLDSRSTAQVPVNDDCANAIPVTLGVTVFDSTHATDGTGLALDPLVCDFQSFWNTDQIYNDVWFTFTPPATDHYDFELEPIGVPRYDGRSAIYEQATCPDDPALVIACEDDHGFSWDARIFSVPMTQGTTYLIRLGALVLAPHEIPTVLSTLTVSVGVPIPLNDDCTGAIAVSSGVTPFNTIGATDGAGLAIDPQVCELYPGSEGQIPHDIWYSFSPTATGHYDLEILNTGNTNFQSRIAVYDQVACPDNPTTVIACSDGIGFRESGAKIQNLALAMGTTYLIRIGSSSIHTIREPAELSITQVATPPAPPSNDDCVNAIPVSSYGVFPFDSTSASTDGPDVLSACNFGISPGNLTYRDVWYRFTPPIGGCTYISTLNLVGFNSRIVVYDTDVCPPDPMTVIACSGEEVQPPLQPPYEAGLDIVLAGGKTVLIAVGTNYQGETGQAGALRIEPGPVAFENDQGQQFYAQGCPISQPFPEVCNGDGGNQMGCTACPCSNEAPPGTLGGCLHSAGAASRLFVTGDPSVSLPSNSTEDLRFVLLSAPSYTFSVLLSGGGIAPANTANPCFGLLSGAQSQDRDGLRCVIAGGQFLFRHGGRATSSGGNIVGTTGPSRAWGGASTPHVGLSAQAGFVAGQLRFFQVVHREDPLVMCMRGLNSSQAIGVTFTP